MPDVDYLAIGDAMIQRLKEQVPELADVLPIGAVGDIEGLDRQRTPLAYVAYMGEVTVANSESRAASKSRQSWLAALAVRNVRPDAKATSASLQEAGALLARMIAALIGWRPETAQSVLARVPGGRPHLTRNHTIYPLRFEVDAQVINATGG